MCAPDSVCGDTCRKAQKSFHRAIELNPNLSSSYANFALSGLFVLGRNEEALRQLRIAEKIDPLSPDVQSRLAVVLSSTSLLSWLILYNV